MHEALFSFAFLAAAALRKFLSGKGDAGEYNPRRNQRRRYHVAPMAQTCELAMNAITAGPGFIAKRQRLCGIARIVGTLSQQVCRA
jgi:hypothetical protein